MEQDIKMVTLSADGKEGERDGLFTAEQARKVRDFHESLEGYAATPLRRLTNLAEELGLSEIYVKDESYRFGLNAFKGLGGSYAIGRVISEETGKPLDRISEIEPGKYTFVTATDGNHGRGVAWAAKNLGQKAVVYMPHGSAKERLENIRALGAHAEITEYNYDDAVRYAKEQADKNGWIMIQDTAWEGYEDIPAYIMQGYMTMAAEAADQLGDTRPTHIFLQAGVGAMAGAVTGFFYNRYKEKMPVVVVAEPNKADCLYQTAKADDGRLHRVDGALDSIMAGLCCGEVCTIGWEVMKHHASHFFSLPDYIAADGMRVLGNPAGKDPKIVSGESGAAGLGLLYHLMTDADAEEYRKTLGLDENSKVLCINTEGDTDQENYKKIVWNGAYVKPE